MKASILLNSLEITLTGLVIFFLSCEKNDKESGYPVSFYTETVTEMGYRIFTHEGEIKNEQLKNSLIIKTSGILPNFNTINLADDVFATILNENQVILERGPYVYDTLIIRNINSMHYWEDKKITTYYPSIHNEFGKTTNYTDTAFLKYAPLFYQQKTIPLSTGYSYRIEQKTCFYLEKDLHGFRMPFVDYCLLTDRGFQTYIPEYITRLGINNRLKERPYFKLSAKDTLIIREYEQRLTKSGNPKLNKSLELTIYDANSWTSNATSLSLISGVTIKLYSTTGSFSIEGLKESYNETSKENGRVTFYNVNVGNYLLIANKDELSNLIDGLVIDGVFMNAQDTVYTSEWPFQTNIKIGGFKFKDFNGDGIIDNFDVVEGDFIQIRGRKLVKKDIYVGKKTI